MPPLPTREQMFTALHTAPAKWRSIYSSSDVGGKRIPRFIWQTMKQLPSTIPPHTQTFIDRNPAWKYIAVDDHDCQEFMEHFYSGTSVLWAFNNVNPRLAAMKADIWRYAVLYVYGGAYIDADSSFDYNLDSFVREDDGFIFGSEPHTFENIARNSTHLGKNQPFESALFQAKAKLPVKRTLIQWMIFSEPGHIFLAETFHNMIFMLRSLYLGREEDIFEDNVNGPGHRGNLILFTTGPHIMTLSIHKAVWDAHVESGKKKKKIWGSKPGLGKYRYFGPDDFAGINAIFKWDTSGNYSNTQRGHSQGNEKRIGHWSEEAEAKVNGVYSADVLFKDRCNG
eukprot:Nk52_evm4s1992 gene=Nk52_evmTU4s1992